MPAVVLRVALLSAAACAVAVAAGAFAAAQPAGSSATGFDTHFRNKTMRVDYYHSGGPGVEIVSLDRVVSDGPWAGSRTRLVDDLNLGKYLYEVIDRRTNRVIYSRGFASIYGEWETTPESREVHRTFHESLRFPWPRRPVQVVLKVRDAENSFHEIWSTVVDPDSRFVNPVDRPPPGEVWALEENGPPSEKVDLLVIGEGYVASELPKFHADARRWSRPCSRRSRSAAGARTSTLGADCHPKSPEGQRHARPGVPPHAAVGRRYNLRLRALPADYETGGVRDRGSAALSIPGTGERGAEAAGGFQLQGDRSRRHRVCRIRVRA